MMAGLNIQGMKLKNVKNLTLVKARKEKTYMLLGGDLPWFVLMILIKKCI